MGVKLIFHRQHISTDKISSKKGSNDNMLKDLYTNTEKSETKTQKHKGLETIHLHCIFITFLQRVQVQLNTYNLITSVCIRQFPPRTMRKYPQILVIKQWNGFQTRY